LFIGLEFKVKVPDSIGRLPAKQFIRVVFPAPEESKLVVLILC